MPTSLMLLDRYSDIRQKTLSLCEPLLIEDYGVQAMPDASPPKWHLAHTTWFFEEFLLKPFLPGWQPTHPQFAFLFNSYYEQIGPFYPRAQRGLLARPSVDEVMRYRAQIDSVMADASHWIEEENLAEFSRRLKLGMNHEQQHQELLLTDIQYNFFMNPLKPAYRSDLKEFSQDNAAPSSKVEWVEYPGGMVGIGHAGEDFAFDNEEPRHMVYLQPFRLAQRLITNAEYLDFIEDGGYRRPELWLSEGWRKIREQSWEAPLYWEHQDKEWQQFTLHGMQPLNPAAPVCHVSYFEADAYARWAGHTLPSEAEWETAAEQSTINGNLLESGLLRPAAPQWKPGLQQIYGDVWEWTRSPYAAYPGFRASTGALGEYNGKFMCNQFVLRGGSCVTPISHIRASYRNFFAAADRWQFSGIRLMEQG